MANKNQTPEPLQPKMYGTRELEMLLTYETEIQKAQVAVNALIQAQQMFVDYLRIQVGAPAEQYTIRNWGEGFIPLEKEGPPDDNNNN